MTAQQKILIYFDIMILWIVGLSGVGKTTLGKSLYKELKKKNKNLIFLDGDELRKVWVNNVGHSLSGRRVNAERIFRLCLLLNKQKINVICSLVSLFPDLQNQFSNFKLIYLKAPMKVLKNRDTKGIYKRNKIGKDKNVVGINLKFPNPYKPHLSLNSYGTNNPEKIMKMVLKKIKFK